MNLELRMVVLSMVFTAGFAGCSSTGPVEIVDDMEVDKEVSCTRSSTCLQRGVEAKQQGLFAEAKPDLVEACKRGSARGCRMLANMDALGALGQPDFERAAQLYRWGCDKAEEGASCHSLGELYRLGVLEGQRAAHYFSRACELGETAGCHDAGVILLEHRESDEEDRTQAFSAFEAACEHGEAAGCVNLADLKASGWGTARDHDEARKLYQEQCEVGDDGWSAHRLASLSRDAQPQFYAVAEYEPEVACQQLELLVVGGHEEMIMAVMDAESDELRACYNDARPDDQSRMGRLFIETEVAMDSRGGMPQIVDDELELEEVTECVESILSRHFGELNGEPAPYTARWGISFIHPPRGIVDEGPVGGCDEQEVQMAVSEAFGDLHACGTDHISRHPDDPGAVMALWQMNPSGAVGEIATSTTIHHPELVECVEEVIRAMEISPFDGEVCPVQVPFVFSGGDALHFSVVGRD